MNWFREKWLEEIPKEKFEDLYLGVWQNDAVYTRKKVGEMLKRGEISEAKAEELLSLRYEMKNGKKVVTAR